MTRRFWADTPVTDRLRVEIYGSTIISYLRPDALAPSLQDGAGIGVPLASGPGSQGPLLSLSPLRTGLEPFRFIRLKPLERPVKDAALQRLTLGCGLGGGS